MKGVYFLDLLFREGEGEGEGGGGGWLCILIWLSDRKSSFVLLPPASLDPFLRKRMVYESVKSIHLSFGNGYSKVGLIWYTGMD